ncbi:WD repeat-containing protein 43 [Aethina tumida]|uniref:WD repeat-containing protein 43 n=1 Tax=Aethina tumida TaxID=116153 RepID=UPI0021486EB8|nr:WD repeat-containing protein 43 [Aethina tumida]
MAVEMASQFSEDGKYFAQLATDGKLKIWDTVANNFDQEFTPDFHLTSPCTCLHFLNSDVTNKDVSPKKKKRRESVVEADYKIALGTKSGLLLVYSIGKADVEYSINSETSQPISCITLDNSNVVYTGAEQNVLVWNLSKKKLESKWKTGNESITAVLVIPNSGRLLVASKNIKLWDIAKKEVLRVYTGHSSDVVLLKYISPKLKADAYFLSGSKVDRLLSCWNLSDSAKDKNAVTSFLMEDVVHNVALKAQSDGTTSVAASVRSGVVHIYEHTLNGKSGKPVKPKTTLQVVSDTGQNKAMVTPIRIYGSIYRDDNTLCIGHGTEITLTFENITVDTYQKFQCLVRNDPRTVRAAKDVEVTKVQTPIVGKDVVYVTPQSAAPVKRKKDGQQEVPMEIRLENLVLNKADGKAVPRADNVAQLLVQGLHSKDKNILRQVLTRKDETVIKNTIRRLPITVIEPLVVELNNFLKGKTDMCQIGSLWLRHILQIHSGILISNPKLSELLGDSLSGIECRLAMQAQLQRLRGRLNLLASQISAKPSTEGDLNEEPLLVFNDKDSSDSEDDVMEVDLHSESDHEWEESEDEIEENNHENKDDGSNDEQQEDDDSGEEDNEDEK